MLIKWFIFLCSYKILVLFCMHIFLMYKNNCVNLSFGFCLFFPIKLSLLVHKLTPVPEEGGETEERDRPVQIGRWQV